MFVKNKKTKKIKLHNKYDLLGPCEISFIFP